MSRRIDIELTSVRDEQTWTWRAVGAREPKGVIPAGLVPDGAGVGDELRVEADFFVDGIEITSVLPAKGERKEPERLEILGSGGDQAGVTTTLVSKKGRGRGERSGSRDRDKRGRGDNDRRGGKGRGETKNKRGSGRSDKRRESPAKPAPPAKPKPKRLKARRVHRDAVVAELPEVQRPIAEQLLKGGLPGVRKAVADQNVLNKTEGRPQIDPAPLLNLAEDLLPGLKQAEWHDRADAALTGIDELDLRDLRSVVVAAESAARSEETRSLAEDLRQAVAERVDRDQSEWIRDIAEALDDDRTVRALRMSSRPPKAGAPLPPDVTTRLVDAANAALSADAGPQRWGTVLDAVAFSPIRTSVTPAGVPANPNDELLETVKRLSSRVPEIAKLFGIEPQPERPKRGGSRGPRRGKSRGRGKGPASGAPQQAKESPARETPPRDEPRAPSPDEDNGPDTDDPANAVDGPEAAEQPADHTGDDDGPETVPNADAVAADVSAGDGPAVATASEADADSGSQANPADSQAASEEAGRS
ncbi:MAG: hypothetical protein ACR2PK_03815 [Acidimicrobiales bacterium]